jgi:hypothetical protein
MTYIRFNILNIAFVANPGSAMSSITSSGAATPSGSDHPTAVPMMPQSRPSCPFADIGLAIEIQLSRSLQIGNCPYHAHYVPSTVAMEHDIECKVDNGTHQPSSDQAKLLADIGGGDRIREFCTRFLCSSVHRSALDAVFLC